MPRQAVVSAASNSPIPFRPEEVAHFVPHPRATRRAAGPQLNDVFVDEHGPIYTVDRFTGGLSIWEMRL